ncbi:13551_t:CDS:2 [Entrophospora sp. SA101]|nr:13551_t:CDS:2 [Entrophospora sp. SA101]CAJ0828833.1 7760_t:CDS:2 [Entrophospora sp. SA101]CAJ0899899.1 6205_t:CDS:2 [Entrophospora sp. SA101]
MVGINMDMMNTENGNNTSIENIIADELITMDQQTETNNCNNNNLDINSRLFLSRFSITDDASREENKIMNFTKVSTLKVECII